MASLCPLSLTPLMDADGVPIVGARVRFFDAGTTTPRVTYRDGLLGSPYDPNDIRTNASGRIPSIWIAGAPYRVQITKPAGGEIEDIDNIPVPEEGGGGPGPSPDTAIETGDVIWSPRTGNRIGWVIPNGLTIGSATSGATGRANADCQDLFEFLWDADPSLVVTGGRGANAASDWAANKTIALPDYRGRALFGLDTMGAPAAARLGGVTFAAGSATTLGATGGFGTFVIDRDELPAEALSGTTGSSGNHSHTGTTDSAGAHTPAGSVTVVYDPHKYDIPTFVALGLNGGGVAVNVGSGIQNPKPDTIPPGNRTFTLSMSPVAAHLHTFTTAAAGAHTHTFTTDALGSGAAHQNMPPFVLGTFYMRL